MRSVRQTAGAVVFDLPRTFRSAVRYNWVAIRNRRDQITLSDSPVGVRVHSPNTSSLHVCDVFPRVGRRILNLALRDWTFQLTDTIQFSEQPRISFVIPHRGLDRAEVLETTIRSIAALPGQVECIVVEQDERPLLQNLPPSVRHVHAPHPEGNDQWHKCFAFNVGVQHARGEFIVCHDSDILVPLQYSDVILQHLKADGRDAVYPQRFLFYLSRQTTEAIMASGSTRPLPHAIPEMVKQNWTGGTLAIRRDAYERIGGFDESFTGWTGEDREFYDRCEVLDTWYYGHVPFVHLWHPPQTGRVNPLMRQQATDFTRERLQIPRHERIEQLRVRPQSGHTP